MLPFIDRASEYSMTDQRQAPWDSGGWFGDANRNTTSLQIPVFNCPSQANVAMGGAANFTYAINHGTSHHAPHRIGTQIQANNWSHNGVAAYGGGGPPETGWLIADPPVRLGKITDGTSQTAMYSEFVLEQAGSSPQARKTQVRTWAGGNNTAETRQACLNTVDMSGRPEMRGRAWAWSFMGVGTPYNHTMLPNEPPCHSYESDWGGSNLMSASSFHIGGVHVLLADGSVRFVSENINADTWWALGTRADGESVDQF
jgi:prepilin-type processing-associated H-X9-DG protein